MTSKVGRKTLHTTPEELREARKQYNLRYYSKKSEELKRKRTSQKTYTDNQLLKIIDAVGYRRLLELIVL